VLGFMRAVAAEVAGTDVTANCVCPAYVRSDMTDRTIANVEARTGRDGEQTLAALAPLGPLVEPEEVAFAVAFLAAPEAAAINGPLTEMDVPGLLRFARMTGDLVKAIRGCRQVVIAAVDGVCVGAGAMIATAADLRLGSPRAKVAFLFTRVGLAGCDMGACAM